MQKCLIQDILPMPHLHLKERLEVLEKTGGASFHGGLSIYTPCLRQEQSVVVGVIG